MTDGWMKHPSKEHLDRWHLDCNGKGNYKASVIFKDGEYELHLPREVTGDEDYVTAFLSLQGLNKMLKVHDLPKLEINSETKY